MLGNLPHLAFIGMLGISLTTAAGAEDLELGLGRVGNLSEAPEVLGTLTAHEGPIFVEAGYRPGGEMQLALGARLHRGPFQVRLGPMHVWGHEETHDFGSPYGKAKADGSGFGALADVSLDVDGVRPFARYQTFWTNHTFHGYHEIELANGRPYVWSTTDHSETRRTEELVLGIRLAF